MRVRISGKGTPSRIGEMFAQAQLDLRELDVNVLPYGWRVSRTFKDLEGSSLTVSVTDTEAEVIGKR